MIWLTWRQFRVQAVTAAAALAAFAILLAVTGPHLAHLYAGSGIGGCHGGSCGFLAGNFLQQLDGGNYGVLYLLGVVIILLCPAVIGIFWGAPLIAREIETGTYHLAWTQSISRQRWLAVKLALTGPAAMAVTEGLSLMQAWWAAPIGRAVGRGAIGDRLSMNEFSALVFATHGITPLGYAAFAFALGVTVGVLLRRAIPAMAVTLAIFAALQIAMPLWVRPHLFTPDRTTG
ncbi:MAG: ABC transporter permease subunit [Streptosporangiaceae bacterium]